MFLEDGIYLNVDIKNKILSSTHCLDLINSFVDNPSKVTRKEVEDINKFFKGRTIETIHTNQRFKVELVNFDKRANNYTVNFESNFNYLNFNLDSTILLTKYYKNLYDIDIDPNSPLILIKTKNAKNDNGKYYPPQLCLMVGLTDDMLQDNNLMFNISKHTKLLPSDKVNSINDIIKLVNEKKGIVKENKLTKEAIKLKSSYEKKEEYGIDICEIGDNTFFGYMIKTPLIKGYEGNVITDVRKPFRILEAKVINYLCIYHKIYENERKTLEQLIKKAGEPYGIKIGKADFIKMTSENPVDWATNLDKRYSPLDYNLVIILLDDYLKLQGLYDPLKKHTLEVKSYPTQFIVTKSLTGKNSLSIISNILLQANTKIGGCSYKVEFDSEVKVNKNF
jgi:hypothetical protein